MLDDGAWTSDLHKETFAEYPIAHYQDQIEWYDGKAARNQTIDHWLPWLMIALPAIAPILIEIKLELLWGLAFGTCAGGNCCCRHGDPRGRAQNFHVSRLLDELSHQPHPLGRIIIILAGLKRGV